MPQLLSLTPSPELPLQAARALSRGAVLPLGLVLVALGGFLLWRAGRASNPSRLEERRGGVVFLVIGAVIGVYGLIRMVLD
ncbi:hypothetical protein CS0771_56450 [Catellatospora sp. IY07-71]|uniref:hypothetical protein n=1 Tax=Catellatospora sp. IY07-71 TaxID=2728827 RepID=UPI001BB30B3F|nr:hypothetical protein [Catellatospora sp. IY07-71]BCJ76101.1 hypothetical protein CS0771_56450 [Catellatospora sp. IY07-71]